MVSSRGLPISIPNYKNCSNAETIHQHCLLRRVSSLARTSVSLAISVVGKKRRLSLRLTWGRITDTAQIQAAVGIMLAFQPPWLGNFVMAFAMAFSAGHARSASRHQKQDWSDALELKSRGWAKTKRTEWRRCPPALRRVSRQPNTLASLCTPCHSTGNRISQSPSETMKATSPSQSNRRQRGSLARSARYLALSMPICSW